MALVLQWHGDRELSAAALLGELHLGATYDAIARRRLWHRMPLDVLAIPLAILAATYLLMLNGASPLVTTAVLCLGAWHRGRQNLGIARHYQRHAGGPSSPVHQWPLRAAFYLPMAAAVAYYASTAPTHEGDEFHNLSLDPALLWGLGSAAAIGVVTYLIWSVGRTAAARSGGVLVHPGERWLVLANAVGFGSAYVLGAWTSSFVLVLALHHEAQYLCFTYALARRADALTGQAAVPRRAGSPGSRSGGDRAGVLGIVLVGGPGGARPVSDRGAARPLLAGWSHLDRASPSSGRAVSD